MEEDQIESEEISGEEMEYELVYPLSPEELYNNIIACSSAYDFLDRSKNDVTIIQADIDLKIKQAMSNCVETVCALIEELHENTVIQDEGE